MSFWVWWVLGLLLIGLEMVVPGIFFLWGGIGALIAGTMFFFLSHLMWEVQLVIMIAWAFVSALVGVRFYNPRKQLKESDQPLLNQRRQRLIGREIILPIAIMNGSAHIDLEGSYWTIIGRDVPAGTLVKVVGVEGISKLRVEEVMTH